MIRLFNESAKNGHSYFFRHLQLGYSHNEGAYSFELRLTKSHEITQKPTRFILLLCLRMHAKQLTCENYTSNIVKSTRFPKFLSYNYLFRCIKLYHLFTGKLFSSPLPHSRQKFINFYPLHGVKIMRIQKTITPHQIYSHKTPLNNLLSNHA